MQFACNSEYGLLTFADHVADVLSFLSLLLFAAGASVAVGVPMPLSSSVSVRVRNLKQTGTSGRPVFFGIILAVWRRVGNF